MLKAVPGFSILGMGAALPGEPVDNGAVLAHARAQGHELPWSPEQFETALGVTQRHWTHPIGAPADHHETTSQDLAITAGQRALDDARLAASDLAGIIVVTTTAPRPSVSTANHVAKALGASGFAMELKSGCTGALYGLSVAAGLYALGLGPVLLVATEAWSKLMPGAMPGPGAVAGDGAAAAVLGAGPGAFLGAAFVGEPAYAAAMMPPGLYPATHDAIDAGDYTLRFSEEVAEALRAMYPRVFEAGLAAAGLTRDDLDMVILHQASGPIIRRAIRDCDLSPDRVFHTLARYGNVSSASTLLSLHDARAEGRLPSGSTVALVGAGGGLTAGAVFWRF